MGNSKSRPKKSFFNSDEPNNINEQRFNDIVNLYNMFKKFKIFEICQYELASVDKYKITEELRRWVNPYNIFTIVFVGNPAAEPHELINDFINALLSTPEEIEEAFEDATALNKNQENSLVDDDITTVTRANCAKDAAAFPESYSEKDQNKMENFVVYSTKAKNLEFRTYFLKTHDLSHDLVDFRHIDNENSPAMLDFTVVVTPEHPSTNHETINKKIIKNSQFRIFLFNLSYPTISDTMKSIIQDKDLTRNRSKNLCIIQNDNQQALPSHIVWSKSCDFYKKINKINPNFADKNYDYLLNINEKHVNNYDDEQKAEIFETIDDHYSTNLSTICRKIEDRLELLRQFLESRQEIKLIVLKKMHKPTLVSIKEYCQISKLDENLLRTNRAIDNLENIHCKIPSTSFAFGEPAMRQEIPVMLRQHFTEENRKKSTKAKGLWKANESSDLNFSEQIDMIERCQKAFCKFQKKSLTLSNDRKLRHDLRRTRSDMNIKRVGKKNFLGKNLAQMTITDVEEPVPQGRTSLPYDIRSRTLKLETLKRGLSNEVAQEPSKFDPDDVFDRHETVKYDSKN